MCKWAEPFKDQSESTKSGWSRSPKIIINWFMTISQPRRFVQRFTKFRRLRNHARYLDFAVEFSGFLYVLARGRDGVFRLDIYHPGQSDTRPISTSYNINGAKLCVDFWRTVYTLNYQVLQLPDGDYPALTEQSVSAWLPSLP